MIEIGLEMTVAEFAEVAEWLELNARSWAIYRPVLAHDESIEHLRNALFGMRLASRLPGPKTYAVSFAVEVEAVHFKLRFAEAWESEP